MGFPHVVQLGRVDRIRELTGGKQEVETVWVITSLPADQVDAARLLELVRLYWCIENGTHCPLDVSLGEDECRVRQPNAVTVVGILRRAVLGEARAWACGQPCKRDHTISTYTARMSRRINQVIRRPAGGTLELPCATNPPSKSALLSNPPIP